MLLPRVTHQRGWSQPVAAGGDEGLSFAECEELLGSQRPVTLVFAQLEGSGANGAPVTARLRGHRRARRATARPSALDTPLRGVCVQWTASSRAYARVSLRSMAVAPLGEVRVAVEVLKV